MKPYFRFLVHLILFLAFAALMSSGSLLWTILDTKEEGFWFALYAVLGLNTLALCLVLNTTSKNWIRLQNGDEKGLNRG